MSREEVARQLEWSTSTIFRIETGRSRQPGWWHSFRDVLPGAHAGAIGAFVILDFPEATDPAVVYVETLAGDIYFEERSDVNRYTLAFDRLVAATLHPDDSVQMIERLARTLRWQLRGSGSQPARAGGGARLREARRGETGDLAGDLAGVPQGFASVASFLAAPLKTWRLCQAM